jgi:ubiquinone/menaquinone biosynthesis C-methylase UbiE
VWGLDGSREMLESLVKRNPPPQVKTLLCEMPKIGLPDGSVDFTWASFIFHEVTPPVALTAEIRRVLKPGGTVAILEFRTDAVGTSGPPRHQRLSPEEVSVCLRSAGFTCVIETWHDDDHYLMIGS